MRRVSAAVISAFTFSVAPRPAIALDLRGIRENNRGVRSFEAEKHREAYDSFARGLGDLPFRSEVHYNLGRTFFENKEWEKAYKESLAAEKLAGDNPFMRFHALFLGATAATQMKRIDEALRLYQKALEIEPDSKEVKTNIELLFKGGQGGGDGDPNQKPQQGQDPKQGQGEQGDQPQDQGQDRQNPTTKNNFKGQNLSPKDVENILDELKQQEEQIRSKFQREGAKDAPRDKDW